MCYEKIDLLDKIVIFNPLRTKVVCRKSNENEISKSAKQNKIIKLVTGSNTSYRGKFSHTAGSKSSVCSLSDPAHNHPITTYMSRKHMCCFNCQKWKKQQNFDSGPCTFTQSLMEGLSVT